MSDDLNPSDPQRPLESHTPASPDSAQRRDDQKFCFACGVTLHASANACPKCGARQPATGISMVNAGSGQPLVALQTARGDTAFCRGCGQTIHATAPLCPHCGAPQRLPNPYGQAYGHSFGPPKSRATAALLAFFLGGLGAHKFYLGEVGLGVLYLLFSWTLIPAIIALIEGILYLTMSDQDFALKYDRRF